MINRFKNPWFYLTLGGLIISAVGVSPDSLTSWQSVVDMLVKFISNPVAIVSFAVALLGQINNPTTKGLGK